MNVIKLMGGLGNQLFQYAFGQVQASNGIDVAYDQSWFTMRKKDTPRPYLLDKFNTTVKDSPFLKQQTFYETEYDETLGLIPNCNFDGYWQYVNYYTSITSLLQSAITLKVSEYTPEYLQLKEKACNEETIAVHIRRGDYLTTKGFKIVPIAYYFEAIQKIKGNILIFSDDLEWCKKIFRPPFFSRKITFVDLPDYLSFDLMKQCSHNITANSSFSIMAAFLNNNPNKVIITPKQTCLDHRIEYEKQECLPKEWILL
jgi:hypothetical protein